MAAMFSRWIRFALVMALLACAQWPALAHNLITQQAYWEDPTGQADFDQARSQQFIAHKGALNRGYTNSATWVRLHIDPPDLKSDDRFIFLRVQPNFLDEIQLFDPFDPRPQPHLVGDRVAYVPEGFNALSLGFVLPVSTQPREVWLRVKSVNLSLIDLEAFGESEAHAQERSKLLVAFGSIGLLLVLSLFNSSVWLWNRNWFHGLFVARTVLGTMLLAAYFGVARLLVGTLLPAHWLDEFFSIGVLLLTLLGCYFEHVLLSDYELKPWTRVTRGFFFTGIGLMLVLYLSGHKTAALGGNALLALVLAACLLCTSLWGIRQSLPVSDEGSGIHRGFLIAYYLLIVLSHPFVQDAAYGLLSDPPKQVNMAAYYLLISTVAMTLIVQFRALNIRRQKKQLEMHVALMNERMAQERLRHQEQGDLLAMLMHEVRNPLAVIELAQQEGSAPHQDLVRKNVGLIRSVLERALRMDSNAQQGAGLASRTIHVSDCLAQAIDEAGPGHERIELVHLDDEQLHTDPEALTIVLVNLLRNALKYGAPEAPVQVRVDLHAAPRQLAITVRNRTGAGGWPDPTRVFQKYYRAEAAKRWPGTGIGLYLVKQLAQRLGGDCNYRGDAQSVSFEVLLPLAPR